jgi:hypothetical protein
VRQSYGSIFCEKNSLAIWNVKKGLDVKVIKPPFYIGETFWRVVYNMDESLVLDFV